MILPGSAWDALADGGSAHDPDSAHEMATLLRNGILANEPEVTLSGEVECNEVYIVAGHKGNPEAVKKKNEKGVVGV